MAALRFGQVELHPHDGLWITVGKSKANQDNAKPSLIAVPYGSATRTCVACAYVHWAGLVAIASDPDLDASEQRRETMRILFNHQTHQPECTTHICRAGLPDSPALAAEQPVLRATYRNRRTATIATPTWTSGNLVSAGGTGEAPRLRGITGNALGEMILTRLDAAGYRADLYGYHSLRAGLVTQGRRAGASTRAVRLVTRHSSDAIVDVYDRQWNPLQGSATLRTSANGDERGVRCSRQPYGICHASSTAWAHDNSYRSDAFRKYWTCFCATMTACIVPAIKTKMSTTPDQMPQEPRCAVNRTRPIAPRRPIGTVRHLSA
ncbi:hypothetical protein P5P86_03945 [Nocardioides sp. BP30]|uniref:hypothetical protein n=1 Tax=Nocardioides sp. BP30 TaxID=3036374 RepID=UPI002468FAC5|nr:hypothetical protein [Nocardioides sp. BP30]WGL52979.1 hypothetical protein P5P86_03945 [Nocardioides sp. BP30]